MWQLSRRARVWPWAAWMCRIGQEIVEWWRLQGVWWSASVVAHAVALSAVLLFMGSYVVPQADSATAIQMMDTTVSLPQENPLEVLPTEEPPSELSTEPNLSPNLLPDEALTDNLPTPVDDDLAASGEGNSLSDQAGEHFLPAMVSVLNAGPGKKVTERLGITSGSGGAAGPHGFSHRNRPGGFKIHRFTDQGDQTVARAVDWIARHQAADGSWSLSQFSRQCRDRTCACKAGESDTAATALALLPFLAAGQTHQTKGKYQPTIQRGLAWLLAQQKTDGDLRSGTGNMYAHGLATLVLCEAYGLSRDPRIGSAAQRAINFIIAAQDPQGGGWRYEPRQPGDMSVVGWQIMALKSGMMAGLAVPSEIMVRATQFIKSVGDGKGGFGYQQPTSNLATSAAGLLCTQYLGAQQNDPVLRGGTQLLLANLPHRDAKNTYYWYYATQVMHNLYNSDWDAWNRRMRRVLMETQVTQGCAQGSWDPTGDAYGDQGGRLMVTAFNTLSLEVYYRNLPLYKLGGRKK